MTSIKPNRTFEARVLLSCTAFTVPYKRKTRVQLGFRRLLASLCSSTPTAVAIHGGMGKNGRANQRKKKGSDKVAPAPGTPLVATAGRGETSMLNPSSSTPPSGENISSPSSTAAPISVGRLVDKAMKKAKSFSFLQRSCSTGSPNLRSQSPALPSCELLSATPELQHAPTQVISELNRISYDKFLKFLIKSFVPAMMEKDSYTVYVSYDLMSRDADFHLIAAVCNSRTRLEDWLLPAARRFLCIKKIGDKDGRTNETCIQFSESFPESIYWLKDKVTYPDLVQRVKVFEGKVSILVPTAHGRHLLVAYMAVILENHLNRVSYNGGLTIEDILMIKHKSSPNEVMKILKVPSTAQDIDQGHQATVMDLRRAADILKGLYADNKSVPPVYFDQLCQDLDNATELLVANNWFIREYLCNHVALLPSSARRSFEIGLYSTCQNCKEAGEIGSMVETSCKKLAKSLAKNDWRKKVRHAKDGTIVLQDGTSVLYDVYFHMAKKEIDPYGPSLSEFLRFRRNYLVHGGQHKQKIANMDELELYAAFKFPGYFPMLVQALFESGERNLIGLVMFGR